MNEKNFKNFLNDDSWELNRKTIEEMMERELEKEPESIDLEFVDSCMNYLTGYSEDKTPEHKGKVMKEKHNKRVSFSKILVAAVVVVLIVSVGMTAYAKVNNLQIADIFVSIFDNRAIVKYSDKELIEKYSNNLNENPLYNNLDAKGIENIMLPFDLYNTDFKFISEDSDELKNTFVIAFENNIKTKISQYKQEKNIQDLEIEGTFVSSRKIIINSIDIYLFERQNDNDIETVVSYQIDKTQYLIVIDEDIETSEKFVLKNRLSD